MAYLTKKRAALRAARLAMLSGRFVVSLREGAEIIGVSLPMLRAMIKVGLVLTKINDGKRVVPASEVMRAGAANDAR